MAGLGEQTTPKKTVTPGHPATGYLVLDLETRESFQAVGGFNPSLLTISVAGTYDAPTGTERTLRLEELETLEHLLRGASAIIGYNLIGFDYAVLKSAFAKATAGTSAESLDPYTLPTVDLFVHLQRQLGFRPKLDDVAAATLGRRKSGNGLEAIRLYEQRNWDALCRYCLDDVRITKDLYEYGLAYGHVKFPDRNGTIREIPATWVPVPVQARMF